MHGVGGTCDFDGTAVTTTVDPSYGSCIYAGSSNSSTTGGYSPTPASGPVSPFGGSLNLKISRLQYMIFAAMLAVVFLCQEPLS
ncbi:glucan endo-1,3-beta-glucosidase 4-like [Quillaja saponaria]|uniref:Glucan endo-1,3-beta-glucosidase 4-like n=1 Tax=Quillaja saponaria TaxID=32244 RepID=A0AAD7QFX7_QUISA|nr:glucan endo-1,3-beta-glucosidase 4-like [Quillaja saponaria]